MNTALRFSFFLVVISTMSMRAVSVRVLIDTSAQPEWQLSSARGFVFRDPVTKTLVTFNGTYKHLSISAKNDIMYINNKKLLRSRIEVCPLATGGTRYQVNYLHHPLTCRRQIEILLGK